MECHSYAERVSEFVQAISKWYQTETGGEEDKDDVEGVEKWKKEWTMRKVVITMKRDEINKEIGVAAGSPEYLKGYAKGVNKVMGRLTDEQKREYMELAKEWNKSRPPMDIQIR